MMPVSDIAERLNAQAAALAPDLLPNGYRAGAYWMASGIEDNGKSASLYLHLTGAKIGHWADLGNARAGEDHGDMLDLLRLKLGLADAAAAVSEAKVRLGIQDEFTPARRADPAVLAQRAREARERAAAREAADAVERDLKARQAKRLWLAGAPIAETPAELYLLGRELDAGGSWPGALASWPGALHFHGEVWCKPEACKVPAMLAAIYRADGVQIGTHRTFLQHDRARGWVKIDSPNAKMVLGNMGGGFVPINKGASGKPMAAMAEGEPVYVTEGIEDAIVVRMMKPEARIIAAISLGNIGAIVLPEAARRLVVVCDRDDKPAAVDQLERSIGRQQARGLSVETVFPPVPHKDMNDWLRAWNAEVRRTARPDRANGWAAA